METGTDPGRDDDAKYDEIRVKRTETIVGIWKILSARNPDLEGNVFLHKDLLAETVETYIAKYKNLTGKCKIPNRIQFPKIAGLVASSIMKRKPLQLKDSTVTGAHLSRHNEYLAAWVGLSICAENSDQETLKETMSNPVWHIWFEDLVYFLRSIPDEEPLTMIFTTFALAYFPDTLRKGEG